MTDSGTNSGGTDGKETPPAAKADGDPPIIVGMLLAFGAHLVVTVGILLLFLNEHWLIYFDDFEEATQNIGMDRDGPVTSGRLMFEVTQFMAGTMGMFLCSVLAASYLRTRPRFYLFFLVFILLEIALMLYFPSLSQREIISYSLIVGQAAMVFVGAAASYDKDGKPNS
jgi:hypothetical protein